MSDNELTMREAAERTGINRRTLTHAAQTGKLGVRRIGPMWVTTLADVREWLEKAPHRPGPKPASD